jgi:NAD(P)-dependent dehydrogenase (short-subunit alcohol dehydrogenase family)
MRAAVDKERFGPWALVTGASSGIGKEFARQIAASGINVVLVARREALLAELGRAISHEFDVQYRAVAMDLSQEGFIAGLADATHDIDIGLVVSNAGTGNPGEFLKVDRQLLQATLRLNTMAHLDIAHHFGAKLAERRRGGLILIGDGRGNWGSVHGERRWRQGVCPQSRGSAPLRVQASGRLCDRRAARADKHAGARQVRVRPAGDADKTDERGAVRIRGP